MQYWKPEGEEEFAGDMMPFWDGRRFHLFYLLDRDHHAEQGGLGGHQWAHASTPDLVNWEHHPLALPIGPPGTVDQHGICTGSIFQHEGVYHAYYATRIKRPDGSVIEAICQASGRDLIHFEKSPTNPLFAPGADFDGRNHRDPCVFRHAETGLFHMLVTASQTVSDNLGATVNRGVLAHYTSEDLKDWKLASPLLPLGDHHCPECPEHFFWNGWWYLIYSRNAQLEYRISRDPLGPWLSARRETIEGPNLSVPRTALFTDGRRIAAGFLPWRKGSRDDENYVYAGNVVFREMLQDGDGTLTTRFVPELMPAAGPTIPWRLHEEGAETTSMANGSISIGATQGRQIATIPDVPIDCTLTFRIIPEAGAGDYGVLLRTVPGGETGYRLLFSPEAKQITLRGWPAVNGHWRAAIDGMDLNRALDVVICIKDSIIDVCINEERTMVERCFDNRGTHLAFFAQEGFVRIEDLFIAPIVG